MTTGAHTVPDAASRRLAAVRPAAVMIAAVAVGTAVVWAAGTRQWWWAAALVGLVAGLALRGQDSWLVGAGAGLLGWGLPLVWLAHTAELAEHARVVSALMGFGPAAIPVVLTMVLGCSLGACGAWVGRSLRWVAFPPRAGVPETQPTDDVKEE